jgi:hypothetical protein
LTSAAASTAQLARSSASHRDVQPATSPSPHGAGSRVAADEGVALASREAEGTLDGEAPFASTGGADEGGIARDGCDAQLATRAANRATEEAA